MIPRQWKEETTVPVMGFTGEVSDVKVTVIKLPPDPSEFREHVRIIAETSKVPLPRHEDPRKVIGHYMRETIDTLIHHVDTQVLLERIRLARKRKKNIRRFKV